jgi:hypothetical protein
LHTFFIYLLRYFFGSQKFATEVNAVNMATTPCGQAIQRRDLHGRVNVFAPWQTATQPKQMAKTNDTNLNISQSLGIRFFFVFF